MRTIDVFGVLRTPGLRGMLEDYQNEINNFKGILEKANPPNPNAYGTTPPAGAEGPSGGPGPTGGGGNVTPPSTPPTGLMPPISVHGGDEIPPPVPTGYGMKPLHPPIVTGIPPGPYAEQPSDIISRPNPYACPSGYHQEGTGCVKNPDVPSIDRYYPPPPTTQPGSLTTTPGGTGRPSTETGKGGSGSAPVASIDKRAGLISAATSLGPSGAAAGGLSLTGGGEISPGSLLGQVRLIAYPDQIGSPRPRRVRLVGSHSRLVT